MFLSSIRQFLKSLDYFGVVFNFKYKSEERYRSATGGLGFILFLAIAFTYGIINLIPVFQRKKMSVIDYLMQTVETDKINLNDFNYNFAVGISSCSKLQNLSQFWDYFTLEFNFVSYLKNNGTRSKEKKLIEIEYCNYSHFKDQVNDDFNLLGLQDFFCPKEINYTVSGIFSDPIFEYIEITLKTKKNMKGSAETIKNILSDECNLNIYFTDFAFDLFNYKNPAQQFLTTQFIVLKYAEVMKMNLFYRLQQFSSYENYFFDNYKREYLIGFEDFNMYSSYVGNENRFKESDIEIFSKIYLRAALVRGIIERRYVKITELAADVSSILSAILLFMYLVLRFLNKFYANESVMHKIFQFSTNRKEKKRKLKNDFRKIINKNVYLFEQPSTCVKSSTRDIFTLGSTDSNRNQSISKRVNTEDLLKATVTTTKIEGEPRKKSPKKVGVEETILHYNLCEILFVMICPILSWKKLKKKNSLFKKGKDKLFFQLDVLNYLKHMQLLDILNYILLNNEENIIVQFLSKPSISLAQKKDIQDKLNSVNSINLKEADELFFATKQLFEKKEKSPMEKRLLKLTKGEVGILIQKMKCIKKKK